MVTTWQGIPITFLQYRNYAAARLEQGLSYLDYTAWLARYQEACGHLHTETTEYERVLLTENGPSYEIESHTYCCDCGAEIEPPTLDTLAVDRDPTVFETELLPY